MSLANFKFFQVVMKIGSHTFSICLSGCEWISSKCYGSYTRTVEKNKVLYVIILDLVVFFFRVEEGKKFWGGG